MRDRGELLLVNSDSWSFSFADSEVEKRRVRAEDEMLERPVLEQILDAADAFERGDVEPDIRALQVRSWTWRGWH